MLLRVVEVNRTHTNDYGLTGIRLDVISEDVVTQSTKVRSWEDWKVALSTDAALPNSLVDHIRKRLQQDHDRYVDIRISDSVNLLLLSLILDGEPQGQQGLDRWCETFDCRPC